MPARWSSSGPPACCLADLLTPCLAGRRNAKGITMNAMVRCPVTRLCLAAALLGSFAAAASLRAQDTGRWTRKYKTPPQSSRIQITILKDDNGKPIENAAVIFHPIQGDRDKGYLELKTNEEGKTVIDVIPIGDTVRLQVIANGFQTYGADYKIDKPAMAMEIRLKRPGAQYSLYEAHDASQNSGSGASGAKPANPEKNANPPAQNGSGSGGQSGAQPGAQSGQNPPSSRPQTP